MPKAGHAEYMKRYRATVRPKRERAAYQEGIHEGVTRCVKLMQTLYGDNSLTGFTAAHAMTKTFLHTFPPIQAPVQR
jgi:hypothetical protein